MQPSSLPPVPEETATVARAAFRRPPACMRLRDELGALYEDADFATLFPARGRRALPPWRLALVTVLQFLEGLSDRQAADAVRARIDWKYALSLALGDPGFDHSVLSEFRGRLVAGGHELLLLDRMLERFAARGLLKTRGRQRTDSTHVLAAVRAMNRLELLAETLRAALNAIAPAAPAWLRGVAPPEWYERYACRIEDYRLPKTAAARDAYARRVGADGRALLAALGAPGAPPALAALPVVATLRAVWAQHFEPVEPTEPNGGRRDGADRGAPAADPTAPPAAPGPTPPPPAAPASREATRGTVRLRDPRAMPPAAHAIESPYDVDARYRTKRGAGWVGYMVHLSETCDADRPRLITHVDTTPATAHEATRTAAIHAALAAKGLPPAQHLVDAAYVSAALLVESRAAHAIDLAGPPRPDVSRQTAAGFGGSAFAIDWAAERAVCPRGVASASWRASATGPHGPLIRIHFPGAACAACGARAACVGRGRGGRTLAVHPEAEHTALAAARARVISEEGQDLHDLRAGVEGTLSQAVRAFGLRRTRYRGLAKTRVQHAATAAALNLARLAAWLEDRPLAPTRTSRFARLAA
jgi:transposase